MKRQMITWRLRRLASVLWPLRSWWDVLHPRDAIGAQRYRRTYGRHAMSPRQHAEWLARIKAKP